MLPPSNSFALLWVVWVVWVLWAVRAVGCGLCELCALCGLCGLCGLCWLCGLRGHGGKKGLATMTQTTMTPAGLEPAIPGSVGRCLIHWATGPPDCGKAHNLHRSIWRPVRAGRFATARLAQSAERKALNLVVVGSSPTVGAFFDDFAKELSSESCYDASLTRFVYTRCHIYSLRGSSPRPMAHKTIALTTELRELAFGKPLLLKAAFESSALALKSGEIEPRPPLPCEGTVNVSSGRGRLAAGRPAGFSNRGKQHLSLPPSP